jgi:hypothetical protein
MECSWRQQGHFRAFRSTQDLNRGAERKKNLFEIGTTIRRTFELNHLRIRSPRIWPLRLSCYFHVSWRWFFECSVLQGVGLWLQRVSPGVCVDQLAHLWSQEAQRGGVDASAWGPSREAVSTRLRRYRQFIVLLFEVTLFSLSLALSLSLQSIHYQLWASKTNQRRHLRLAPRVKIKDFKTLWRESWLK